MKKVENYKLKKLLKGLKPYTKMDQKIMLLKKFYDIKIEDYKFHQHKNPISTKDLDINKIVLSNKQN